MKPAQLIAHFDRISDAPDAVPRLRRFILDLAVRGKLVEQCPNEEPASVLLNRIRAEKALVLRGGSIRQEKPIPRIAEADLPFPIPVTWGWSQLAEVGFLNPRNNADDELVASFVPMPLISAGYGVANTHQVRQWGEVKSGYTHFAEGDVALAKITPCFENGKSTVFRRLAGGIGAGTTELHVVRPVIAVAEYILIFLKSPHFIESGIPKMTGTAGQKRVPADYFAHSPFPLPPVTEQHRIVAKVDELMSLCDRLEAAQAERERRRDRLAAASLHRLNQPAYTDAPEVFREHARFYLNHLPRLTTRPEQINQLRQTILNLAVRGRLVAQDPKDEPASELLQRIHAQKMRMVQERKIRQHDLLPPIAPDERPFCIPECWEWTRLGTVCFLITDGAHHTPKYEVEGVPFLSVKDVSGGAIDFAGTRFISETAHRELCKRCKPEFGDILLTKVGTTGIAVTVDVDKEFSIFVSVALLKFSQAEIDRFYLRHLINSPFVKRQSADNTQGIGNKNLVLRLINQFLIPVPPLAEQRRIVAKVDELMALCDQLEARLIGSQTESCRLLDAVLHEALAPTGLETL
jgi:type I restriction enzyme S subunit